MALFDFFRRLAFFKGRDTEGLTAEDLDFDKWIQAHRDWRTRLTNYINGVSGDPLDEAVICRDDRCALGQWIHGHGEKFYGDLEKFRDMRNHHAEFHRSAGKVVHCFKNDGLAAARKLMHNDFDRNSLTVINDLQALKTTIRG
ncbi:MAG: methyl-accepting chemotaxis sensory transducer [Rhodocyclaceae bacterium]|nr:methyl-accepting chemotaxis sensory transducer [Rhodocyclaceae bacterium]